MADKFTKLTPELYGYVVEHTREDALLARLREETRAVAPDWVQMQVAPEQGAFLALLARAVGARRALELGTFTGYSTVCIARALPADGLLVTCDVSEEWTAVARRYLDEAGLAGRVELRLGPALETMAGLEGGEPFDFVFIDADKPGYPAYWERALGLVRAGGLVVVDNVFAGGGVVGGDGFAPESVEAIRELNDRIVADERVDAAMLGVSDGITVALRR